MVCVHCHILLRLRGHTANQCHSRPLAQHPCATARESLRGPEGRDPTGRALGRLRGSIRQTFVIDGQGTPACRGRRRDMECPPTLRVTSAVILCARSQPLVSHRALWEKATCAGKGHPMEHQDLPQSSPGDYQQVPPGAPLCPWPLTLPVTPPTAQVQRGLVLLAFQKSLTSQTCLLQETSCYP